MYEILIEKRAWAELTPTRILINLDKKNSPFDKNWTSLFPEAIVKIIEQCCEYDLNLRISSKRCLALLNEIKFNKAD